MNLTGVWAPPTRASHGVVRWARGVVIALLAALAVLIHHESAAVAVGPVSSSAAHIMTPGMVPGMAMSGGRAAPSQATTGHGHGSAAAQDAERAPAAGPAMISAEGPACDGMHMPHCSAASLEVVKLAPPAPTPVFQDPAAQEAAASGAKAAGTVGRAPPDLSVLSRLRI